MGPSRHVRSLGATLLLATVVPLALGALAGRALLHPVIGQAQRIKPYRELLADLDRTMKNLEQSWASSALGEGSEWLATSPEPAAGADAAAAGISATAPAPLFNLYLGGIVWRTDRHCAYVNDRVVTTGEMIEGFRVESIEPNRVVFTGPDGQTFISDLDEQLRSTYPGFPQ